MIGDSMKHSPRPNHNDRDCLPVMSLFSPSSSLDHQDVGVILMAIIGRNGDPHSDDAERNTGVTV